MSNDPERSPEGGKSSAHPGAAARQDSSTAGRKLYIAHQIPGRTRLKAASPSGIDADLADELSRLVGAPDGVERIEFRPHSGSLLVEHPGLAPDELIAWIRSLGLALVEKPETDPRNLLLPMRALFSEIDHALASSTEGRADMRTLMFLVLILAALVQLARGRFSVPAISLFWYAYEVLQDRGKDPE